MSDPETCERCKKNAAQPPHSCPYQVEINDAEPDVPTCNCCIACQVECADET